MKMRSVLTIAGSDSSGGAGIQADLKTITVHGLYGTSVLTGVTAQNTMGVFGVQDISADMVAKQLDCIFQDIRPDAIKIGMVSNVENIEIIAEKLRQYEAKHIVIDPVMVASSGDRLLGKEAIQVLKEKLLPMAEIVTPNLPEAMALSGIDITDGLCVKEAAAIMYEEVHAAILLKGGHSNNDKLSNDLLFDGEKYTWYEAPRVDNPNNHGTGCTLSSAVACHLAMGNPLHNSISAAKGFVTGALQARLDLGQGIGPLNHMYRIRL